MSILDLPTELMHKIMSLDASVPLSMMSVSHEMKCTASDNHLWWTLFNKDMFDIGDYDEGCDYYSRYKKLKEYTQTVSDVNHAFLSISESDQLRWLIAHGADVNYSDHPELPGYPLGWYTCNGAIDLVQILLDSKGIDIHNACDVEGETALIYAVIQNNIPIAQLLIEKGADVNIPNAYNWSCLQIARHKQSDEMERLLLKNGALLHPYSRT